MDDYLRDANIEMYKNIPNEYLSANDRRDLRKRKIANLMIDDIDIDDSVVMDTVDQHYLIETLHNRGFEENVFVIIVYTCLKDLIRNIESRRKTGDIRHIFVFRQFANCYLKTTDNDKAIDTVNRAKFKKQLKKIKYEFENPEQLTEFCDNIFSKMDIIDDNDYQIGLRENYTCDYLLDTKGKTKKGMFDELKDFIQ